MNTDDFKKALLSEKARLEKQLGIVGEKNPDVPGDWIATPGDVREFDAIDPNETADAFEEQENRAAVEGDLEGRLEHVRKALAALEEGTYGTCTVCGNAIEEDRLKANPAAHTCKTHIHE